MIVCHVPDLSVVTVKVKCLTALGKIQNHVKRKYKF